MSLSHLRTDIVEGLIHTLDRMPAKRKAARPKHLETGREGELAALFYLRRHGYTIVARDWKSARAPGDIDLIAWEADTLCFVEVKTRSSRDVATAEAAIDEHKRKTLRRLAGFYVRQLPEEAPSRFDVLSIYFAGERSPEKPEFELFQGAFDWS